jgi:acyl-CoA thioester hydrolase
MARIDRARFESGLFPHRYAVATRYSDMDSLGHVNNVAAAEILQEARHRFILAADFMAYAERGPQLVVASSLIEYAADMMTPLPIEVSTGLLEMGRTSFRLAHVGRQADRIGVYAEIVQVVRDSQGPVPIPDEWRAKLEGWKVNWSGS